MWRKETGRESESAVSKLAQVSKQISSVKKSWASWSNHIKWRIAELKWGIEQNGYRIESSLSVQWGAASANIRDALWSIEKETGADWKPVQSYKEDLFGGFSRQLVVPQWWLASQVDIFKFKVYLWKGHE